MWKNNKHSIKYFCCVTMVCSICYSILIKFLVIFSKWLCRFAVISADLSGICNIWGVCRFPGVLNRCFNSLINVAQSWYIFCSKKVHIFPYSALYLYNLYHHTLWTEMQWMKDVSIVLPSNYLHGSFKPQIPLCQGHNDRRF